jgi:hypothetical protein
MSRLSRKCAVNSRSWNRSNASSPWRSAHFAAVSAGMLDDGSGASISGGTKHARGSSAPTRCRPSRVFWVTRRSGCSPGMRGKVRQWTRTRSPYVCWISRSRTAAL